VIDNVETTWDIVENTRGPVENTWNRQNETSGDRE